MRRAEAGVALLEAIIALAILGSAGLALGVQVRESLETVRRVRESEARVAEASAYVEAIALWTRSDLDRRLGDRSSGPWRLVVGRPTETIYEIALADSTSGAVLVRTALYRLATSATP